MVHKGDHTMKKIIAVALALFFTNIPLSKKHKEAISKANSKPNAKQKSSKIKRYNF